MDGENNTLLAAIAHGESGGNGDYDSVFGDGRYGTPPVPVTQLTINQAIDAANQIRRNPQNIEDGNRAGPLGKYQFVGSTIKSLRDQMGLTGNELFNPQMQDAFAWQNLANTRGNPQAIRNQWVSWAGKSDNEIHNLWQQGQQEHQAFLANGGYSNPALLAINTAIGANGQQPSGALGYAGNSPLPPGFALQAAVRGDMLPMGSPGPSQAQQAQASDDDVLKAWLNATPGTQKNAYQPGAQQQPAQGTGALPLPMVRAPASVLPAATPQPQSPAPNAPSPGSTQAAPVAPGAAPTQDASPRGDMLPQVTGAAAGDDDILKQFLAAPQQGPSAPTSPGSTPAITPAAGTPAPTAAPAAPVSANDVVRATATGIPIVGGLLNRMDAATNATLAPVMNGLFAPKDQLQGDTWGQRYDNALTQQNGMDAQFAAAHPTINTAANIGGTVLGTLAGVRAAPTLMGASPTAALGQNIVLGGLTNGAIGATDAAIRSGGDLDKTKFGGEIGGIAGAAGPVLGKVIGTGVNKLLDVTSGTTAAARNVANVLSEIGMTPDQAQAALAKMGPNATLADLDPALANEAGGVASLGGQPTSILKNAFAARAAGADDRVAQAVQSTLGPRPDLTQAAADIQAKASSDATPFYTNMRAGAAPLDAQGVVDAIDSKLATANGSEKNILTKFRSYLVDPNADSVAQQAQGAAGNNLNALTDYIAKSGSNDPGLDQARAILVKAQSGSLSQDDAVQALSKVQTDDPTGNAILNKATTDLNNVSPLKNDPQALLKVRQAMDDDISKMPMSDTTGGKNAQTTANGIRGELDQVLKQNPDIKAGDLAYSTQMANRDALQEGTELFKPGTRIEDVQRSIAGKTPDQVSAMQQGALGSIWDVMDNARQGDLQAVKSLLGKSTANRAKLDALFPNAGDLFDKIQTEAAMRATENNVSANSLTAARRAIQQKYSPSQGGNGNELSAAALVGEAAAGNPGAIILPAAKYTYGAVKNSLTQASRDQLVSQTARGLSATGADQANFLNLLQNAARTNGVSNALTTGSKYAGALLGANARQYIQNRTQGQ